MRDLNRISIGQHYPMDSPVHSLDARAKIVCALALIIGAFVADSAAGVLLLFLFALLVIYAAKLPPLQVLSALRTVLVLLLITALMVIPAAAACRLATTPESMAFIAAAIAGLSVISGLLASAFVGGASGPCVVLAASCFFALTLAVPQAS